MLRKISSIIAVLGSLRKISALRILAVAPLALAGVAILARTAAMRNHAALPTSKRGQIVIEETQIGVQKTTDV